MKVTIRGKSVSLDAVTLKQLFKIIELDVPACEICPYKKDACVNSLKEDLRYKHIAYKEFLNDPGEYNYFNCNKAFKELISKSRKTLRI